MIAALIFVTGLIAACVWQHESLHKAVLSIQRSFASFSQVAPFETDHSRLETDPESIIQHEEGIINVQADEDDSVSLLVKTFHAMIHSVHGSPWRTASAW